MFGRSSWRLALPFALLSVLLLAPAAMTGESDDVRDQIAAIRARLRADAGPGDVSVAKGADLPMVTVTLLAKESYKRLAWDLTGSYDSQKALRSFAPSLGSGTKVEIPRALLRPNLSDPRTVSFRIGEQYQSLWGLARGELRVTEADIPLVVRNIQRLNGIVDGSLLHKGQRVRVPESMLTGSQPDAPALKILDTYRVTKLKGLERKTPARTMSRKYVSKIKKKGLWKRQGEKTPVDLVVIHTTEHHGAPFGNVAKYIKNNRSAHYLIGRDGKVYRLVPETQLAYGSGQSLWDGRYEVDHQAINIEIFADTDKKGSYTGISNAQYGALERLIEDIRARRPEIHPGRVVTHRMVALNYRYDMRQRKGDPYEFEWSAAGLPDNSLYIDQDLLLGRARLHDNRRYADRVTPGQQAAARMLHKM